MSKIFFCSTFYPVIQEGKKKAKACKKCERFVYIFVLQLMMKNDENDLQILQTHTYFKFTSPQYLFSSIIVSMMNILNSS